MKTKEPPVAVASETMERLRRVANTPDDFERWVDTRHASRKKKSLDGMRLAWWEITTVRESLRQAIKNKPSGQILSVAMEKLWRKVNRRYLEIQFTLEERERNGK